MIQQKKISHKAGILIILIILSVTFTALFFGFKKKKQEVKVSAPNYRATKPVGDLNTKIFFASNGKNSVYKIKKGDKWSVIWNGTEGKDYDFVSNPVFSPDGSQLAYSAEVSGQAYVVVNNTQEIYAYRKSSFITWSQDGLNIAFVATKDNASFAIITSTVMTGASPAVTPAKESQTYGEIGTFKTPSGESVAIVLSPNGQQVGFVVVEDGKTYLVINDQKDTTGYDSISNFSVNDSGEYSYEAQQGDQIIVVEDNQVISTTDAETSSPPDSSNNYPSNPSNPSDNSVSHEYPISTNKDVNLDQDRLDYSGCQGQSCNF